MSTSSNPSRGSLSTPRSRLFDDEAAFYSYGYDNVILSQQVFPATSSQVSWLQAVYPVGSTIAVTTPLALTSPANGSSVGTADVDFTWSDVGASWYELLVDDDPDFSSPDVSYANIQEVFGNTKNIIPNWFARGQYSSACGCTYAGRIDTDVTRLDLHLRSSHARQSTWEPLYRLYNPPARDHFYCSNAVHALGARGRATMTRVWRGMCPTPPWDHPDMVFLYRLWDFTHGSHYYTTDPADKDDAIQNRNHGYEGITGYLIGAPRRQGPGSDTTISRSNFRTAILIGTTSTRSASSKGRMRYPRMASSTWGSRATSRQSATWACSPGIASR